MKIISKYKDFYDYLVQDNDPDMIYVRSVFPVTEQIDENINTPNKYFMYYSRQYDLWIDYAVFGIYPYVYRSPYVRIKIKTITELNEFFTYFFTKEDLMQIHSAKQLEAFCGQKAKEYCAKSQYLKPLPKYEYLTYPYLKNIGADVLEHTRKVENKDVFVKMNAPVFCEHNEDVINLDAYPQYRNLFMLNHERIYYLANVSFVKLGIDMLRFWMDELMNINTYNNIENFLWSIKQEPIANPDNKTKIISHGFDLKESFRNIK